MEVTIEKPFHLHLDTVEVDENIPSMRMKVTFNAVQFGHELAYRGAVWFDCSAWDAFVAGLRQIDAKEASLVDMDGCFALRVVATSGKSEVSWEFKRSDVVGSVVTATYRTFIDDDTLSHVNNQFENFLSW